MCVERRGKGRWVTGRRGRHYRGESNASVAVCTQMSSKVPSSALSFRGVHETGHHMNTTDSFFLPTAHLCDQSLKQGHFLCCPLGSWRRLEQPRCQLLTGNPCGQRKEMVEKYKRETSLWREEDMGWVERIFWFQMGETSRECMQAFFLACWVMVWRGCKYVKESQDRSPYKNSRVVPLPQKTN